MTYVRMADAAFAANIPPGFEIAGGYYPGRDDYHPWAPSDWDRFPGWRVPITVPDVIGVGSVQGSGDGAKALSYLRGTLRVPEGAITVVDLETEVNPSYVLGFGAALQQGYRVWVYGSFSTVFGNPGLNGYWVADYTPDMAAIDQILQHEHVRAVQFAAVGPYDASLVKQWTEGEMWHG